MEDVLSTMMKDLEPTTVWLQCPICHVYGGHSVFGITQTVNRGQLISVEFQCLACGKLVNIWNRGSVDLKLILDIAGWCALSRMDPRHLNPDHSAVYFWRPTGPGKDDEPALEIIGLTQMA
ncbi:MAG: hypothetical protein WCI47_03025 [bacterium]